MNFDWREYLNLADELAGTTLPSPADQESRFSR